MITLEQLKQSAEPSLARSEEQPPESEVECGRPFDMEAYLRKHKFEAKRKPWSAHPGGWIFELEQCPFDSSHVHGSAVLTLQDGKPGFKCHHNGCSGRNIKDLFVDYPPTRLRIMTPGGEKGPSEAEVLVKLARSAKLFHTSELEAFADFSVNGHRETWPLRSKGFRLWLTRGYFKECKKPPGSQAMQNALGALEAAAQFDSPEIPVFVRVAPMPESTGICIDLCNEQWQALEITPGGWRIVNDPPVRFRRSRGMLPLPNPEPGGNLLELRKLVNIGNDDNWALLTVWLLAAYRPRSPYPILIIKGEQGSAKSALARLIKQLVDPSRAPLRAPPREERDLLIAAHNSWLIAYDNLSRIPPWLSDGLCRLATGGGYATRELYTDTDEVIIDATRPTILNGIDHLAERADLADRAIILDLPTIDERTRREETEMADEISRALPKIFGALLDALSSTLAWWPDTHLLAKPRMADFARLGVAAEAPLGLEKGTFLKAYRGNRADSVQETLEFDPVAVAIVTLFEKRSDPVWNGTCKELLKELDLLTEEGTRKSKAWPKNARGLSSRLRRAMTFLREAGIEIVFHPREGARRPISISQRDSRTTASLASAVVAHQTFLYPDPNGLPLAVDKSEVAVPQAPIMYPD